MDRYLQRCSVTVSVDEVDEYYDPVLDKRYRDQTDTERHV